MLLSKRLPKALLEIPGERFTSIAQVLNCAVCLGLMHKWIQWLLFVKDAEQACFQRRWKKHISYEFVVTSPIQRVESLCLMTMLSISVICPGEHDLDHCFLVAIFSICQCVLLD